MLSSLNKAPYAPVTTESMDNAVIYCHKSGSTYHEVNLILAKVDNRYFMAFDTSDWSVIKGGFALDVVSGLLRSGYFKEVLPELFSQLVNSLNPERVF